MRVGLLSDVRGNNRAILGEVYKPVMADVGDKGDRLVPRSDKGALQGQPDAQAARNAGASDLKAAEATNPNRSNGSVYEASLAAKGMTREHIQRLIEEQGKSFEIEGDELDGKSVVVDKHSPNLKERQLSAKALTEQSETLQDLETAAKTNPVAEVLLGFRNHAEAMVPGPEKDRLTKLAKEQAAELLPPRVNDDQESCGVHEALLGSQSGSLEILSQAYSLDYGIEKQRQKAQEDSHRRLDGKSASSNDQFLDMFLNGSGNDVQVHSRRGEPVLEQFIKSPGVQFIREQYYKQGCPANTSKLSYGTKEAFVDTVAKPVLDSLTHGFIDLFDEQHLGSVGTQVGGFGNPPKEYPWAVAKATRCSQDGKADEKGGWVQFEVNNIAGAHSWGAHALPDRPLGATGPYRSIIQVFRWVEPIQQKSHEKK